MNCKRVVAILLMAAMVVSLLPAGALAQSYQVASVGTIHRESRLALGDSTQLTQTTVTHTVSGLQEERYIEWGPNSAVSAMVAYGNSVYGGSHTLNTLQQRLQAQGKEMVAAINGDYFTVSTGVPLGILITDGILRASDNYQWSIGFPGNGGAFIAKSPLYVNMTATIAGASKNIVIDQVNHARTTDRLILYTPDYGGSTQTGTAGVHVVLNTSGQLTVGGTVTGTVAQVLTGTAAAKLKPGQMVLSVDNRGPKARLDGLVAGTPVSLKVTCADARFATCTYAIGAYQKLLTNGQVAGSLEPGTAPRTAVGVRSDGTAVLYTVDGRQTDYSVGLSLTDVAKRLKSLGCIEAVNLDGGGSTIMGAKFPGQSGMTVTGRPSDGAQRKVADYIVLVNNTPSLGATGRLFVYPTDVTVLQDATLQFSATATDENYHTVPVPALDWWTDDSMVGGLDGSGFFMATSAGECQVAVTGDNVTGGARVRVVDTLDTLRVANEKTGTYVTALNLTPNESVGLAARGFVDKVPVVGQDACFSWDVSGNIGTIDGQGNFKASDVMGSSGHIVVMYNGVGATLPVTVGKAPVALETFETDSGAFGPGADAITFAAEKDSEKARFGLRAGRVNYDFTNVEAGQSVLTLPAAVALSGSPAYLNLWVAGDNSGNTLSLGVTGSAGAATDLAVCTLNFTGYRFFQLKLPAGAAKISALRVNKTEKGALKGSLLLDQLVAAYHLYDDTVPPQMDIDTLDNVTEPGYLSIEAHVLDDAGISLKKTAVTLKWDGAALGFTYNAATGKISAKVPLADSLPHRLTLEAADPAGNRDRRSRDILMAVEGQPLTTRYADVEDTHWALDYIAFLDGKGVIDGVRKDDKDYFSPDKAITRADMAIYTARMLGLNLAQYDKATLPFADLSKIPANALREVRALYAIGMVKGRPSKGKLYFDPAAAISRAEFCTLLGRTLPRGYVRLPSTMKDAANMPSYAKEHMETLLTLGVIGGYPDNTMRPANSISRAEAIKVLYMFY